MNDKLDTTQDSDEQARDERSADSEQSDSSTDVNAPFAPHEDDDSALGDTDQHSTA